MPKLRPEIKDFKYHTWHVINYRSLDDIAIGPEFEAGGWKWYVGNFFFNFD